MNNPSGDKGRGRMLQEIATAQHLLGSRSVRGVGLSYDPWTNTEIDYAVPYSPQVFMHPNLFGVGARRRRRALPAPPPRRIAASGGVDRATCKTNAENVDCPTGTVFKHKAWGVYCCGAKVR